MVSRPSLGRRASKTGARGLCEFVVVAIVASAFAAPANAALPPATLDPVAPGVPAHGRAWELVTPPAVTPARVSGFNLFIHTSALIAMSDAGDRVAYLTAGSPPDVTFGSLMVNNLATRGAAGWASAVLEGPDPATENLIESPRRFDREFTTSLWVTLLRSPQTGSGLYVGKPGGGYALLAKLGPSGSFVSASEDLQRIVFQSSENLLPADATREPSQTSAYEIDGSTLRLIDVKDDGSLVSNCGSTVNSTSPEGQGVVFAARPDCGEFQRLFLRAGGHTTAISASQCTLPDCGPASSASYLGRAPSGSPIYFETTERLTNDDSNSLQDIYSYDISNGELSLLYERPASAPEIGVGGRVFASSDGSRAYFFASGQLMPGLGAKAGTNLYLEDAQGLHFIAAEESERVELSRDGRYALFPTAEPLAAGDSDASQDLYRFDAATGTYKQISAGIDGRGNGAFDVSMAAEAVADVGQRVFFTTAEQLVPQDLNQEADVYEWTEGGLSLVSAGTPGIPAEYLGVTPDGSTVLFRTAATLLPRDRDGGELDIYAARIGGGFAEPTPAGCEEDGCAAAPGTQSTRNRPGGKVAKRRLELGPIDAAALRQLARRGSTILLAEVPAPGRLSARGRARIGKRPLTVASGEAEVKEAGPVRLRLRLTRTAQARLAAGGDLRVALVLSFPPLHQARKTAFTLRGGS